MSMKLWGNPFASRRPSITPSVAAPSDGCDPTACYNSFAKHWQQAFDIIQRTRPSTGYHPNQDDVLAVVKHLEHMVEFLLLELKKLPYGENGINSSTPCLEFLLSENLLDHLFTWSLSTGRFINVVRSEQMRLYEILVTNSSDQLLIHEPFFRPLLKLLASCTNECFSVEVEKRLVVLLNQLCIALMKNAELLDLFFCANSGDGPAKFIIFSLLIPFVHREGEIGQQSRDALLHCISLSNKNENVGSYIEHSNVCPVLATGLSGLYSRLPRKLRIESEDWYQLTPDDVNDIPELIIFMNSLEFCNAVIQVAHPVVKTQMLDFLYQGFLVPVMAPALLQSTVEELVTATAYLDLFLRSVSEPGLLYSFIRFLLEDKYDNKRIIDCLIERINSKSKLSLVTLALFETLVNLNCEDIMLELVFRYLIPCTHVMLSQRRRVRDIDPYCRSSDKFLSLSPACCTVLHEVTNITPSPSLPGITSWHHFTAASSDGPSSLPPTPMYSGIRPNESLYGNYLAYLRDAREKIELCSKACARWVYPYDGECPPSEIFSSENKVCDKSESSSPCTENVSIINSGNSDIPLESGLGIPSCDTVKSEDVLRHKESQNTYEVDNKKLSDSRTQDINHMIIDSVQSTTNYQSLPSIGDSSGYESSACKKSSETTPENEPDCDHDTDTNKSTLITHKIMIEDSVSKLLSESKIKCVSTDTCRSPQLVKTEDSWALRKFSRESSYVEIFNTTPDIGPFLNIVLKKLECMMSNGLHINLRLTGLISRLAVYPQPLLHSFLLNHSLVFQPSIRSLFQVLGSLKHRIDTYLSRYNNREDLVAKAREFLIAREEWLVNAREKAVQSSISNSIPDRRNSLAGQGTFERGGEGRKSLTSAISGFFRVRRQPIHENTSEQTIVHSRYRNINNLLSPENSIERWNVVLCAVLLDEWLKELAAITQEQIIFALNCKVQFNNKSVW